MEKSTTFVGAPRTGNLLVFVQNLDEGWIGGGSASSTFPSISALINKIKSVKSQIIIEARKIPYF